MSSTNVVLVVTLISVVCACIAVYYKLTHATNTLNAHVRFQKGFYKTVFLTFANGYTVTQKFTLPSNSVFTGYSISDGVEYTSACSQPQNFTVRVSSGAGITSTSNDIADIDDSDNEADWVDLGCGSNLSFYPTLIAPKDTNIRNVYVTVSMKLFSTTVSKVPVTIFVNYRY